MCEFKLRLIECVKAEMSGKAGLEFSLDPKFECEAPTYVDFKELALKGNQYDDKADEWFGKTLHQKSCFIIFLFSCLAIYWVYWLCRVFCGCLVVVLGGVC